MSIEELIHKLRNDRIMYSRTGTPKLNLYMGHNQWRELQEAIHHIHNMRYDPKVLNQRAQYAGMDIYRVDAEDHLEVHIVDP